MAEQWDKSQRGTDFVSDPAGAPGISDAAPQNDDYADDGVSPETELNADLDAPGDGEVEEMPPQHYDGERVETAMGTAALHSGFLVSHDLGGQSGDVSGAMPLPAVKPPENGDAEMMLRLKAGELQCFDFLMNKYRRPMVHFMFRMVHNQAVAEEMAQEVFLRVFRSRETYRAEARFSTWLYRIATNLAVNHARDTKNERLAPKLMLDEPDPETGSLHDVADSTPTIEADLLRQERLRAIKQHVLALPERQRTAVLMHKYQDMDYKAIGAVLKLSESATKSLLFRAYQTLRERLKEFV